jgi:alkylation response protein AidB-like acyl-CoA dehydrogenase
LRAGNTVVTALLFLVRLLPPPGSPFAGDALQSGPWSDSQYTEQSPDGNLQGLHPVEHILRDAKFFEIGEGTSEIQRLAIARDLLKEARI